MDNSKNKHHPWQYIWPGLISLLFTAIALVILIVTPFSTLLMNEVDENGMATWKGVALAGAERLLLYAAIPFLVAIITWFIKFKRKRTIGKHIATVFESSYLCFSVCSALYSICGLDKMFGDIFGKVDAYITVVGLVATLVIKKNFESKYLED